MGKKARKAKKKIDPVGLYVRPTEAREAHNDFQSAGAAVRVIPPIVQLHAREMLTQEEFEALAYYRDQASLADSSLVRSCIDFTPRTGNGPGIAVQSAIAETRRIESGLGGYLTGLLRFVVRDDNPIRKWIEQPGAGCEGITVLELKYAAGGIVR